MKLHIFNTEHDLALAFGGIYFTPPHAARQLRADLGFLPALLADDVVLVEDIDNATNQIRHLKGVRHHARWVTLAQLATQMKSSAWHVDAVCPWGWDRALCHQLVTVLPELEPLVPSMQQLDSIRDISNRRWAAAHLGNTGIYCTTEEAMEAAMRQFGTFVLKSPWSCSGRGIRYRADNRWACRVIEQQGGIMVEPCYNKVVDFGMGFHTDESGHVNYDGLSLFETVNGAYKGNLIAPESEKRRIIGRYLSDEILTAARQRVMTTMEQALKHTYVGPFGVDMMVYRQRNELLLAACVELNLRCTMGHVAIALTRRLNPDGLAPNKLMRIEYDGNHYHLRIVDTDDNMLNTTML